MPLPLFDADGHSLLDMSPDALQAMLELPEVEAQLFQGDPCQGAPFARRLDAVAGAWCQDSFTMVGCGFCLKIAFDEDNSQDAEWLPWWVKNK